MLTQKTVNNSPLDLDTKSVYTNQLRELQTKLASYDDRSIEHFVITQSLEELTSDFWAVVENPELTELSRRLERLGSS